MQEQTQLDDPKLAQLRLHVSDAVVDGHPDESIIASIYDMDLGLYRSTLQDELLTIYVDSVRRLNHGDESESGQSMAEYGLLLALIAVVCVATVTALGLAISGTLGSITGAL